MLGARIAEDGQWRFAAADSVSARLKQCVLAFEDRRFYKHWGLDPRAILRALRENYRAGRVVSGGSTLTMQVARMARGNRARTLPQKLIEAAVALRLEVGYGKEEIFNLWLAHAPFGGNTVGVEAAAYRYFNRSPAELSWGEAATLAVLPNSPALIHPGRNRQALRDKRDRLLQDMFDLGLLSAEEMSLAKLEKLPEASLPLPNLAPHFLQRKKNLNGPGKIKSTLDAALQRQITSVVRKHHKRLAANQIHNLAVMVSEVSSGKCVAYVGNVPDLASNYAPAVDMITARRSPGSLLKPILYGLALEHGDLLPHQLLPDVPTSFQSFRPANFHEQYDGAVAASEALTRSLNIPFVYLLSDYGTARFHRELRQLGFQGLHRPAGHYGLSLILGGGEITMEEIHGWFLRTSQQLRFYYDQDRPARQLDGPIGAGAAYSVFEALRELKRPDESGAYRRFSSHRPVAWKTGTSFGYRDAWAVGATPALVVSVWAGNADGEGRPGLVGVRAAAPVLFDVFRALEAHSIDAPKWFERPFDEQRQVAICPLSGHLSGPHCKRDTIWMPSGGEKASVCPYHQLIITDPEQEFRVNHDCYTGPGQPIGSPWFTLPSRQAHFYRRRHPNYRALPPWQESCLAFAADSKPTMEVIYPSGRGILSQSKDWEGQTTDLYFEIAHQDPEAEIYWHLDGSYLSTTKTYHSLSVPTQTGSHRLTLVDAVGNRLDFPFQVK